MKLNGILKNVVPSRDKQGAQRVVNTKDGKTLAVWDVTVEFVYQTKKGDIRSESLVMEYLCEGSEQPFSSHMNRNLLVEFFCDVREWQGRFFNSIRLFKVSEELS